MALTTTMMKMTSTVKHLFLRIIRKKIPQSIFLICALVGDKGIGSTSYFFLPKGAFTFGILDLMESLRDPQTLHENINHSTAR